MSQRRATRDQLATVKLGNERKNVFGLTFLLEEKTLIYACGPFGRTYKFVYQFDEYPADIG